MNSKKFNSEYQKLNSKQKEAVEEIEGPVMVIAGPGTGKTQIIAMRIANILQKTQVNPSNILCLTFTNSGVYAMKERLLKIIGLPSYQIVVTTFHAFCNDIINQFPEKFLIAREINQLDDLEQILIIQNILKNNDFKYIKPLKSNYYYQKAILEKISKLKQENITPDKFKNILKNESTIKNAENSLNKNLELLRVYKLYQIYLHNKGLYDYNDMILFVLDALKTDSELLSYLQEKYHYILVDEFQDANSAQNEITNLISSYHENPNIFTVGDDEQSIYRFQGAAMENILDFKKQYPSAKIIVLDNNYRSGQSILDTSRNLISNNKKQISNTLKIKKDLKSKTNYASKIVVNNFESFIDENYFIASEINKLIKKNNVNPSEIAVLYRRNNDADELKIYLDNLKIPYQNESVSNILDDHEIQKILQFLKVLDAPNDINTNLILLEIMHYPFFKISTLDIYRVVVYSGKNNVNIFSVITNDLEKLNLDKPKVIREFAKLIIDCRTDIFNNTLSKSFEIIINKIGYLNYLLNLKDSIHINRLEILFKYIQKIDSKNNNMPGLRTGNKLSVFLGHIKALSENNLMISDSNFIKLTGVNLMTVHKSKGLEFDIVFMMHLTAGHWENSVKRDLIKLPMIFNTATEDSEEEERRLFYVALTRARKIIYLSYSDNYSDTESTLKFPSLFLSEIMQSNNVQISSPQKHNHVNKLEAKFKITQTHNTKSIKIFIESVLKDIKISPTSFSAYLDCPEKFFFENVLKIPRAKTFSQSYGTAIHFALDYFFKKYKKDMQIPIKSDLISFFIEGLKYEIMDKQDHKNARKYGSAVLRKYYDNNIRNWKKTGPPISSEYNFAYHNVHYNNIPITGRIDKIENLDINSRSVRIVDYKTAAPKSLNYLLGKTRENNLDYLYQAYFYKLLSESDPLFTWKVSEIVFDFISDQGFKTVVVPIDKNEYDKFKTLLSKTYDDILKMKFVKNLASCRDNNKRCDLMNVCMEGTNLIR